MILEHASSFLGPLAAVVVGAPAVLVALLGCASLGDRPFSERSISRMVQTAVVSGLLAAMAILSWMLYTGQRLVAFDLGHWVDIPHYQFTIKFIFDRLSVPFVMLSFVLCGTIGAFATKYMHRERGFNRFFALYAIFLLGMVVTSLAGTVETLFAGWELVGLSSALLVAFFHERPSPCRNGLYVWSVYRVSDAALLIAALTLHHMRGHGDFLQTVGAGSWPDAHAYVTSHEALVVGLLLLIAAAAKSALIPFSDWLPRAMEGPTPSSAVFYGALSVHLGAFLLLRFSPLIEQSTILCALIVVLGVTTAVFGTFAGRVQTDIKSALSFASLTQVGIIVAEIGLGFRYIALVHIIGHGCLRTLQFLRAPTLLYDYRLMENALGRNLPHSQGFWTRITSQRTRGFLYRLAIDRGYLDAFLQNIIVAPFVRLLRWCDAAERRWTDFLSRGRSRESDRVRRPAEVADELL